MSYIKSLLSICAILMSLCGCAALLVGAGIGAIGGYAVSKDSVTGELDTYFGQVWDKSIKVADDMGAVTSQDRKQGLIEAEIKMSKVLITVDEVNKTTTRLTVKARKNLLPNPNLANQVFLKIYKSIQK